MASEEKGKKRAGPRREGLRKVSSSRPPPLLCPICDISLQPVTIELHFQLELERLKHGSRRRGQKRKHSSSGSLSGEVDVEGELTVVQKASMILDGVKRRRFVFQHGSSAELPGQPCSSHSPHTAVTCPVCSTQLPPSEQLAAAHISNCIASSQSDSSDSETYEEYTWGDVTRVRATSMLDARTRANLFNGTVILREAEEEDGYLLDVEGDSSEVNLLSLVPSPHPAFRRWQCLGMRLEPARTSLILDQLARFGEDDLISVAKRNEGESPSNQDIRSCDPGPLAKQEAESKGSCDPGPSAKQEAESKGSCDPGPSAKQEAESKGSCDPGPSAKQEAESKGSCDPGPSAKQSPNCLVCMDMYTSPLVSVQCWHVFCEQCWLQALGTQKLCPKCKAITCASDLRRIFL